MKPILIFALLVISACRESPITVPAPSPTPSATVTPSASPSPSASPAFGMVHFAPVNYYTTPEQRKLIANAEAKVNEMKNSDCVYNFIKNRKLIQTDGKTPTQVADEIRAASGTIPVEFYYNRWGSAVAYREPPSLTIHLNSRFYGSWSSVCEVVSVLLHESVGHSLLNYDHDFNWSPSREYSVPYSINHAVDTGTYSMSESAGCCK